VPRITRTEWQRVILFAVLVMILTTLPYLVAWHSQNDDWEFGGFLFGVEDGNQYLTVMRMGAQGDWLFTIRYTSEPHDGVLAYLPYILLGKLASLFTNPNQPDFSTTLAITFHLARIFFGILLILIYYRFAAHFLPRPASRWLALLLITLGGGLGWLLQLVGLGRWLGSLPVDFYVPEGYSFLILFGLPHLVLARCALLVGFLLLFDGQTWRASVLAGISWLVMGLNVPFYIAVVYVLLGCWGVAAWLQTRHFPWQLFWRAVTAALVTLPLFLYTSTIFATNEVIGRWFAQSTLPSPHPLHYVLGYGVLAVPALIALRWAWHKQELPHLLLVAWIVVSPVLLYLPFNVQRRRLAEGVLVPLSILAVAGLSFLLSHHKTWRRGRIVLLWLTLPTTLLLWLGGTFSALHPARPLFNPSPELAALDRLNRLAPPDAVVLSSKDVSNYLTVRTDLRGYIGHGPQTMNFKQKEQTVKRFFAGELDPQSTEQLLSHVDYILAGLDIESRTWAEGLNILFSEGSVTVYKVQH